MAIRDLGIIEPGTTLYLPFHTFDSNDPTASVTLTGLATSDIEIYKDGGTTQRASDSGYALLDTDGIDFDGVTGIHGLSINLADNTTAGFYAAGSQYWVVISSVTVDAATVNFVLATFRIGLPAATLNTTIDTLSSQTSFTLTSGPAEDDALNGCWAVIHDVASAVQKSIVQILDYTGSTKTVTLAAGATFTAAATDNISIMGPMPLQPTTAGRTLDVSSGGEAGVDWANVGSPTTTINLSGTTVKTATDVETDTADIQSRLPAALVNSRMDCTIDGTGMEAGAVTAVQSGLATSAGLSSIDTATQALLNAVVLASGTIGSVGNDTTHLHLDGLTYGDDALNDLLLVVLDDSTGLSYSCWITDWDQSDELATVTTLPFTPENAADTYQVLGIRRNVTVSDKTGFSLASSGMDSVTLPANLITATSLHANAVAKIWETALTEAYGTDGSAHTAAQLLYLVLANIAEFAISGTTKTCKKLDGSTTAATYTLDDATDPTSITRAS